MVLPIKDSEERILGVLEVCNSFDCVFTNDDHFLADSCTYFIGMIISLYNRNESAAKEERLRELMKEACMNFSMASSIEDLRDKIQESIGKIFGSD